MKALTVWQPWAWAICSGHKPVENRTWAPPASVIGPRISIHAAARVRVEDEQFDTDMIRTWGVTVPPPDTLPRGAIVATARIVHVVRKGSNHPMEWSAWFSGPYGWVLADVIELPEPVPCRGAQRLWTVPEDVAARVLAAEAAARAEFVTLLGANPTFPLSSAEIGPYLRRERDATKASPGVRDSEVVMGVQTTCTCLGTAPWHDATCPRAGAWTPADAAGAFAGSVRCATCGGSGLGEEWDCTRINDAGREQLKPCPHCRGDA